MLDPDGFSESLQAEPARRRIYCLTPELEDYAKAHGQTPADALDELLAAQLAWEKRDYQEAVEGIRRGMEDVKAGRGQDAEEFLEELRLEHGFPR